MNRQLKQTACVWKDSLVTDIRHERLHDRQPATWGCTPDSKVLGGDIPGPVEIGVQPISTLAAPEVSLGTAIVAGLIPASRAGLRGVPGIHQCHRQSTFLRFVPNESLQLIEAPAVDSPARRRTLLDLRPTADVGQVLQHNRSASWSRLDDALAEHVIVVTSATSGLPRQSLQMSPGTRRALRLQLATQPEGPRFQFPPATLAQEPGGTGHCRTDDTKIDPHHCVGGGGVRRFHGHHDVQPPAAFAGEQVGGIGRTSDVRAGVGGHVEWHRLPSLRRGQAYRATSPITRERMQVVAGRAVVSVRTRHATSLRQQRQGALDRLGGLDAGLNDQVADEGNRRSFRVVIRGVVQRNTILFTVLPSVGAHGIESSGEQACRLGQRRILRRCGVQQHPYRPFHLVMLPYVRCFRQTKGGCASAVA